MIPQVLDFPRTHNTRNIYPSSRGRGAGKQAHPHATPEGYWERKGTERKGPCGQGDPLRQAEICSPEQVSKVEWLNPEQRALLQVLLLQRPRHGGHTSGARCCPGECPCLVPLH